MYLQSSTYKLSGASVPKTFIYISVIARLQRVIIAECRISEPQRCSVLVIFVIWEHAVCFLCYVAANTVAFSFEPCTFTTQNGGKSYPGRDVKAH